MYHSYVGGCEMCFLEEVVAYPWFLLSLRQLNHSRQLHSLQQIHKSSIVITLPYTHHPSNRNHIFSLYFFQNPSNLLIFLQSLYDQPRYLRFDPNLIFNIFPFNPLNLHSNPHSILFNNSCYLIL